MEERKGEYLWMKRGVDGGGGELVILGVDGGSLERKGIEGYLEIKGGLKGYVRKMKVKVGKYLNVGEGVWDVIEKEGGMVEVRG